MSGIEEERGQRLGLFQSLQGLLGQSFRAVVSGTRYRFAAVRPLDALVVANERMSPTYTVRVAPATPALQPGRRAGWAVARLHGRILGKVPLAVTERVGPVPSPPRAEETAHPSWWQRSLDSVGRVASSVYHLVFG